VPGSIRGAGNQVHARAWRSRNCGWQTFAGEPHDQPLWKLRM
ncbi:MAG: hypothetical protein AVDCRST_MAG42-2205, partial [uncultured Chthoniobacterales bacterium]